ncbi:hypothetical protein KKF05_02690 [Patescibacteria group bacterium]|nr:hypothetical protein [Patescibacteria group bacterium]MBU1028594.1 hypothetical protein [Patescibacteria group bacterium]MBU1916359.1 hypothetical protein [Patescibacteria group bacterium]
MASKKKTDPQPEFSPEDVTKFMKWLTKQDQVVRDILKSNPDFAVKIMRNIKSGRYPMDGSPGTNVGILYASPF